MRETKTRTAVVVMFEKGCQDKKMEGRVKTNGDERYAMTAFSSGLGRHESHSFKVTIHTNGMELYDGVEWR